MASTKAVAVEAFDLDPDVHFQCFGGKPFYPFDPMRSLDCITVDAIAHSLSRICRFKGRTRRFYSVAEHSLYVSAILPDELQIYGLLHDAHEAFSPFGDVCGPCKPPFIDDVEAGIDLAIANRFGLKAERFWIQEIDAADRFMLAQERWWLLDESGEGVDWGVLSHIPKNDEYASIVSPVSGGEVVESFATKLRKLLPRRR